MLLVGKDRGADQQVVRLGVGDCGVSADGVVGEALSGSRFSGWVRFAATNSSRTGGADRPKSRLLV